MTCQHPACSFHIFSSCTNHCMKNVCLKHLMEHGDIFLHDYTNLLNHLDKSTDLLMKEVNFATTQINQRRNYEIEQINRKYDEEQQTIRKQLAFAETANHFFKDKQKQLIHSKEKNECLIAQHDFEQLKSYINQIRKSFPEKLEPLPSIEPVNPTLKACACPLVKANVFGIKLSHNIRFDCDGPICNKWNLLKHFESYHRMLPEYALRLRNAVFNGQSSDQTELFSENENIINEEYLVDCPLIDSTNIFGARSYIHTLIHFPCTKKQMTMLSIMTHLTLYHKMKYGVAKKIFQAMKTKSLHSDLILFENDQRVAAIGRKK